MTFKVPDGTLPPDPPSTLYVTVGKPYGEASSGDHEYVILVQGTNLVYVPSGATTRN